MTTQTDVAQLYTAFFNRAPDAAGLAYSVNKLDAGEISLEAMARNWVDEQPEGQAKYHTSLSNADFIAAIYSNVLGRVPDTDGAQYWQDQLVSGVVSGDVFVAAIIKGAHSNTSAQGLLDAKLLDYKAAVGVAYADGGINNTTLAAKVLTTVTASDESLRSSLSLVKLIPVDSSLTPSLVAKFSDTLDKVASLIVGATSEQADLATYLSTLGAGVTSSTNLTLLLDKIGTVATSALTDSTALDNPVALGNADVAAANPPTGGSGTPTNPTDPTPTLTATSADGVLKIAGSSTVEVRVDMTSHEVTSGAITVSISGDAAFTGVDASAYRSGSVTAVGTVKEIVEGTPVYTGVDTFEVVDKAWTILTWADYYLLDVDKISVLDNSAGTLSVNWYDELVVLTGNHDWSYTIRDTVSAINAAEGTGALVNTSTVVVADTLANLQTPEGTAAIQAHPGYTVLASYANIVVAQTSADPLFAGATDIVVHDTVAGLQAALTAGYVIQGESSYEVEDTAAHLLAINATDPTFLKAPGSVLVTGDDAGDLTLAQREELGKVTDDDFWAYSINDTAEHIVAAAQGDHVDFLQRAGNVMVSDSVTFAQVGAVAAVPNIDTSNWHFSIVDSVANTVGYMGVGIGDLALTATASQTVDAGEMLDGAITAGVITLAMAGLSSAATFSFATGGFVSTEAVDVFANFAVATDKIDLTAFGLTAQDVLSVDVTGDHIVADGHYAVINGVALVGGVYQASTAADAGSLVVWDADTTGGIKQVGVFVADGTVNASQLITGAVA